MKIGQFTETFYPIVDGVGRVAFSYAVKLAEAGHECYVITPMTDTGFRGVFPFEIIDYTGVKIPSNPQYKTGVAIFDRHYYDRINMLSFDIIHAHTPFSSGVEALRLSKKMKCPIVATFHSRYYDDFYKATGSEAIASIGVKQIVRFYERCDEVWAVGRQSGRILRGYGYSGDVIVMENGTDISEPDINNAYLAQETFDLPPEKPILLYAGQLNWKKNILNILEAAAELKSGGADFALVLAGQGPDDDEIKAKVRELNIWERTIFTGHISDQALLSGLYQCALLLVFPSLYDSSPMVLREAAVMSLPAVLTINSPSAEVVTDGVNGFLAENTSSGLAVVLKKALSDTESVKKAGERARESIPKSWDDIMENVLERYQQLIAEYGRFDSNRTYDKQ